MLIELLLLAVGLPILGYLLNKFYFSGGRCTSTNRLDGKVAIITGANTGIGYETALDFARRGAKVIMACRDLKKAEEAANKIKLETGNEKVSVEHLDLVDLESVKKFADSINKSQTRLDLLINNAGIMMCPLWRTKQGFEMQFGVNHLAHFYLTYLLIDLIKRTPNSRIINVSSRAHYDFGVNWNDINWKKSYNPIKAYGQSKSANVLFSRELAKRLKGTGVFTASLHPGAVRTELLRYVGDGIHSIVPMLIKLAHPVFLVLFKSSYEGAQTTIHCAVADGLEKYNGFYFSDCKPKKPREHARRDDYAVKLWDVSCKMVGINWE